MWVPRLLAGLVFLSVPSAHAESWPSEVSELRVAIPKAQGKGSWGRDGITKAVRKTMAEAVKTVSPPAFTKAQRKLKLRGSKARSDSGFAKAGREAGADYVLDLKITKKQWLYTATARLINVETGEEQMNFRSQYYKPNREAKDRGFRIARRTIEKLAELANSGQAPKGGGAVASKADDPESTGSGDAMADNSGGQDQGGSDATDQRMDDGQDPANQKMDDGASDPVATNGQDPATGGDATNKRMDDPATTSSSDDKMDGSDTSPAGDDPAAANTTSNNSGNPSGPFGSDGSGSADGSGGADGSDGPTAAGDAPASDAPVVASPVPRRSFVFNEPRLSRNSDRLNQPDPVRELMREGFEQPAPLVMKSMTAPPPAMASSDSGSNDDSDATAGAATGAAGADAGADAAAAGPWGTTANSGGQGSSVDTKMDDATEAKVDDATEAKVDDATEAKVDDATNARMEDEPAAEEPKAEEPGSNDGEPKSDEPAADTPSGDAPQTDEPSDDESKSDEKVEKQSASESPPNTTSSSGNTSASSGFNTQTTGSSDGGVSTQVATVADDTELLRFSLGAGSGLLRTYALRSAAVARSSLSYNLVPLSYFQASAELIVPKVPVFWQLRGGFRPVGYQVDPGTGTPIEASGWLLDVETTVGYQIKLGGSGRQAVRLMPGVGARMSLSNVSDAASDVLLSNTLVAVIGQLGLRLPINSVLEIGAAVDGGYIPLYSERPFETGNSGSGFTVAGDLGARIWLSKAIGIAIDNRFTYERIDFSGVPSRQLPRSEVGALTDASVTTRDLRTAFSVAVRL